MEPRFIGEIRQGKLYVPKHRNEVDWHEYIKQFEGKDVFVVIGKPRSRRTKNMNDYMWAVVYKLIADETGYESEQIHGFMKEKFGLFETLDIGPETIPKSTTKYTVEEMQEYWEKIKQWAAEFLNLYIPDPDEVGVPTP